MRLVWEGTVQHNNFTPHMNRKCFSNKCFSNKAKTNAVKLSNSNIMNSSGL